MERASLALLNHFRLYTRGQTAPVLDRLLGELLSAWRQLPPEARPWFSDPALESDVAPDLPHLTPDDWRLLEQLLHRMRASSASGLGEDTGPHAASQPGVGRDSILALNREVSRRLWEIASKPDRWQHHVYNLFAGITSLCGELEGRPERVSSRMWALLRAAVGLCRAYARAPGPGQEEALSFLRTLADQLTSCQPPDTWRHVLVRWSREWMSPDDRYRLVRELPEVRLMDYEAHPIRLYVDSAIEAEIRAVSCAKEPGTVAWIEENLWPGDIMYDIGANVGPYSLIAAKHTDNRATVFAFEPSFANFHQLCRNVLLNRCETCITPLSLPLCRRTTWGRFHYHNTERGGSAHTFGQPVTGDGAEYEPVAVVGAVGFSLDDLSSIAGLPVPNLIKLDVDGLEKDILEGASATLRSPALRSVLLELNEEQASECAEVFDLFHRAGLSPREKHPLSSRLHNFLFFRPERLPERPPVPAEVPATVRRGRGFAPRLPAG